MCTTVLKKSETRFNPPCPKELIPSIVGQIPNKGKGEEFKIANHFHQFIYAFLGKLTYGKFKFFLNSNQDFILVPNKIDHLPGILCFS